MGEWTKQEENFIRENYNNYTKQQLSEMLKKSKGAIQAKANRMGIKKKSKYYYNKNFFKDIKTEKQAYWLGFIFADGWITDYELGIELNADDDNHLRKFNKDINGNYSITYRSRKPTIIFGKQVGYRNTCAIKIYSKEIVKDLISHGCLQNKSLIIDKPINIDKLYFKDFIRGYFDGNGSINFNTVMLKDKLEKYPRVSINSGSLKIINWMSNILKDVNIETFVTEQNKHNGYNISIKSKSIIDFLNYIYKDSTVYLDRKYNKYNEVLSMLGGE